MSLLYRSSAALLVAAMLAGCGAQSMGPVSATAVSAMSLQAKAVVPVDPQVQTLITSYKAINGYDDAAMSKRESIVAQLGDSDSDLAANFLESEYDNLSSYPDAVRNVFEDKLVDALLALDTYDSEQDDAAISAGPGDSLVSMETYFDATTRRNRHKGFLHWVTSPFRWVGNGIKHFMAGLTGKRTPKRHRRPSSGGGGFPGGGSNYPGGGNYPGNGSYGGGYGSPY